MSNSAIPAVFISHGSPMHALEPGVMGEVLGKLGQDLPRPRAILVASAHWETRTPTLTGTAQPETIYDFYGFPEALYRLRYPAPGSLDLANRAAELLAASHLPVAISPSRGLDHGAWSVLLHTYPEADIPVVQVSLQTQMSARHHYDMGAALAPLAEEGVLLLGSGQLTHNLREWDRHGNGAAAPYVLEFQSWIYDRIMARDHDAVIDYRRAAPHAVRAHPTEEHFLPILFALGAAGTEATPQRRLDSVDGSVLARDLYTWSR